ncbi:MAG: RagB/SusD family nutrient uptake outer membrane protein [Alistipes senegalensis]
MRYLLGESLLLRTFFYFDLIEAWGDVPCASRPIGETGDVNKPRSDHDEIYTQIVADLEEAVIMLTASPARVSVRAP